MMVSDLWAFLIICAGLVVSNLTHWGLYTFTTACLPLGVELVRLGGMSTAVLHLLTVSVNHYLNIVAPFHYKSIVTRPVAILCALLLWTGPLACLFVYSLSDPNFGLRAPLCLPLDEFNRFRFRIVFLSTYSACFIAMLFIYVHIGVILTRMQAQLHGKSVQLQKKKKTINTAILIVITFFFGWIPGSVSFAVFCSDCVVAYPSAHDSIELRRTVIVISTTVNFLILLKTFINPIIYGLRIPEIKEALIAMKSSAFPRRAAPIRQSLKLSNGSRAVEELLLKKTSTGSRKS